MGITKTNLFSEQQNGMADMAKVLANPARVAILEHLMETNKCINGDLVGELGLAQPTISQHLKELRSVGLVKGNVDGTKLCYCIDPKAWGAFRNSFVRFFDQFDPTTGCC